MHVRVLKEGGGALSVRKFYYIYIACSPVTIFSGGLE